MNTLFLYDTKTLKEKINTKVFAGDNKITKINVQLPDNIGGYPKRDCEYNLRAIIPEGNLSYMIDPLQPYFYITNDITEKAQTVKLMMIITHEGNVIGRTNTVDLIVNEPAEAPDPPLTPREEFDEVIAEQRAEIAEQAGTISTQGETITQQTEQITELNGEVSALEGTVAEQQATITRQNTTIDELNRRVPPLQTLDPINPSQTQQTYTPESPNIGFPQVIVNAPTAEGLGFREDYYKKDEVFLGKVGTYNPFPEHSVGGIYITEVDEDGYPVKFLIKDYEKSPEAITPTSLINTSDSIANITLQEVIYENCPYYTTVNGYAFASCRGLRKIVLPQNITTFQSYIFENCSALTEVALPAKLQRMAEGVFRNCTSLKTIVFPHGFLGTSGSPGAPAVFVYCSKLKNVYLPNTMISLGPPLFMSNPALEFITLENGFNCNNLNLSTSTLYSQETIVSCLEALADRTGQTAYTITFGSTNLNKLTAEQKAIATNKNWNLA